MLLAVSILFAGCTHFEPEETTIPLAEEVPLRNISWVDEPFSGSVCQGFYDVVCEPEDRFDDEALQQAVAQIPVNYPITDDDAYTFHRNSYQKRIERFLAKYSWADHSGWATCRDFMDELIYMGDWDMLKYCDRDLSLSHCINDKDRKRVQEQRAAIYDGKRDEFLVMLEKRKKRFISRLEKKVGIICSI